MKKNLQFISLVVLAQQRLREHNTTIVEGDYNNNDWTYGTLFGFGSEHLVSENISMKIEHIISNYGEEKINTNASWANTKQYMDLNDSTTHVGLQYRF